MAHDQRISLAATTYQTDRRLLLGRKDGDRLGALERQFDRPMGLVVDGSQSFWLSTRFQLWPFVDGVAPGQTYEGGDPLYVPRRSWITGALDIHDLVINADGQPVFVATAFNGLGTVSDTRNARMLWKPPFISQWVGEDRCHLNGLALREGTQRYVTAVGPASALPM